MDLRLRLTKPPVVPVRKNMRELLVQMGELNGMKGLLADPNSSILDIESRCYRENARQQFPD